ncbi:MAG: lipid II flippase MurJ [bacterium]|nr:lipid II flippase MurJ [bacterium]
MMNRALQLLSYEVRGLHAAVYMIAFSALLSSVLALLRDRMLAHTFGASATLDVYYAAFRIPDLIFVGTAALVSVYVLIPALARRSTEEQSEYIDTILIGFSFLAVLLSGIAALLAPFVLAHLFPQLSAGGYLDTLVSLTRIMLLQPILLGLSNILAAITQTRGRYALYSISPLLYNIGIICGIVFFYPLWGLPGLALGVVLGAFMHFGIQVPSVFADGFFHRIPRMWNPRMLYETAAVSVPRSLTLSMNQLAFIGLTALAAALASGSIAVFMFAYNLQAVPLAIIGASYSVAAFPTLAAALARGERNLFIEHIAAAARYVVFWALPVTALIIVLRAYMVRVVLGSGAFDWTDTRLTAAALALFALSLTTQAITLLLVRGYYAAGRTFVPFLVSTGTAVSTVGLGALFIGVFQNELVSESVQALLRVVNVPGSSVLALAFAYASVSIIGTLVLIFHFERRFGGFLASVWRAWTHSALAAFAAGCGTYIFLVVVGPITFASTTLSVFTRGFAAGVFGIIVAGLVYAALGSREYAEIVESIRNRWEGARPPIPQNAVVSSEEAGPASPQ